MTVAIDVYDSTLTTLIASLTGAHRIGWSQSIDSIGGGKMSVAVDDTVVQANPTILDAENLVKVKVDGTDRFAWVIRRKTRQKADGYDRVDVFGTDAVQLLSRALVYPPGGLQGQLQDQRLFAWQAVDYVTGGGWTTVTGLGPYSDPTDPALDPDVSATVTNEVQTVALNADPGPFPWGPDYPSATLNGTWKLAFNGQTTAAIQWDANAAAIKAALEALPNIDGVTVVGDTFSPFTVEFDGPTLAGKQQPLLVLADHSDLRHTAGGTYVTRTTAGTTEVDATEVIEGWPTPAAVWLGNFGTLSHYRRIIDVSAATQNVGAARLYVASLGPIDVWWDGDFLGSGASGDLLRYDLTLYETQHSLAIRAEAPVVYSIVRVDADGEPTTTLYRSSDTSGLPNDIEVYEGSEPPGVTPGFILKTLFDEASARGFLPPMTYDFTATLDSFGNAWTLDVELGVQVGNDSVLSVAERLRDVDVYFVLDPDLTLRVWEDVRVDRGTTPDTSTVTFDPATVLSAETTTEDELLSALLIRTADSWVERHIAGYRREGFLSLGTVPSDTGAIAIADRLIDQLSLRREGLKWSTSDQQGGVPQPWVAFDLGDIVEAPTLTLVTDTSWVAGDVRVMEVGAKVDDGTGHVEYVFGGDPR